jgi:exodeoxyribonuclease-3
MYGVITYVRNDVATQITTARGVDWDDEGRVLVLEMSDFAMINLYAVNGTDAQYIIRTTGETTGQTRHQRKRQFNHLLKRECLDLASRGYEICIVGDINISRTKIDSVPRLRSSENHVLARKEFNEQFLPETGLVDVWRRRHGEDARGFTWYMRGAKVGTDCARVDIILVSEGLYRCTREVEIEEWGGEACRSDHTLMWVQIDGMGQDETSGDRRGLPAVLDVQGE